MKRLNIILLFLIISFVSFSQDIPLDTILTHMSESAAVHVRNTPDYEAFIYIQGDIGVNKKNFLLKMIPKYYRFASDTGAAGAKQFEMITDLTFTNPDIYSQKILDISYDNEIIKQTVTGTVFPYVHGNVYSPMLYGMLYSPIAKKAKRYYEYTVDKPFSSLGHTYLKVSYKPRLRSYKLISGYFIICTDNWSIRELYLEGKTEFMNYSNTVRMGAVGSDTEFMTRSFDFHAGYHFLGNKLFSRYQSQITYLTRQSSTIHIKREKGDTARADKSRYDLSLLFSSGYDTLATGYRFFTQEDTVTVKDTVRQLTEKELKKKKNVDRISRLGTFLVSDNSLNMSKNGRLEFSPIISPFLLNYSSTEGISYAQKLTYRKPFTGDRELVLTPKIGYNFKENSFHWYFNGSYVYAPRHNGKVYVDASQGDRIYTDEIKLAMDEIPEQVFDPDNLYMDAYRSMYVKAGWESEVVNGLFLGLIVGVYNYTSVPKSDLTVVNPSSSYVQEAKSIVRNTYSSFVPEARLEWTPHLYYYYNGKRKVNLYSRYPTFSLSWAYAIKNVLNCDMTYQRVEIDIQHHVNIGLLSELSYRVGCGAFYNYEKLYFSDFWNFRRNNLPVGWNDEIGGAFQLLDSRMYNQINKYLRGHLKLDVPFLLTTTILRNFPLIMKERLYANFLYSPDINPYFELGYGLGTYAFDVGVFWGGELNTPNKFGVKFTVNIH